MQNHPTHKSESGFTLIEMLIVIAIIGILASVAIPQYNQYKIRGYDAQTKQALKNMHLLCNAYWLDTSTLRGCDLSKIKEPTYGFNQNADVAATLSPSPQDNFCASAKHNDSPNTFSIDSAALISSGSTCSGSGGSIQTASVREPQAEDFKCWSQFGRGTLIDEPSNILHGFCVLLERASDGPLVQLANDVYAKAPNGVGYVFSSGGTSSRSAAFQEFIAGGKAIVVHEDEITFGGKFSLSVSDGQGGLEKVDGSEEVFSEYNSMDAQERYAAKCRATPTHPDCLPSSEWNNMSAAQRQVVWQAEHCRVMPNAPGC